MIIMLFDMYEHRLCDIDTIESCIHTQNSEGDTCTISAYGVPDGASYAAFTDIDGAFQLFYISSCERDVITKKQVLYCENAAYELATDTPLVDVQPTNVQAGAAVTMALSGTRWKLGTTVETVQQSTRWFYITPHAALQSVVATWGIRVRPRVMVTGASITGRYIDILSATPIWRGKRFEIGKDILTSKFTVDRRNVATAILPRGKGEESGDGYTARLGIADVVWNTQNGDPADKPSGQTYIEDVSATALYGVTGNRPRIATKVYEKITDAGELIQAAWDDLRTASVPVLAGSATAFDLERAGFPHEAARYNDRVAFVSDGVRYTTTIVGIAREYATNGADNFQFGALEDSSIRQLYTIKRDLNTVSDKAGAGAQIAQANPDLIRGIIDTAVTSILSTMTNRYTDTDGGDVYETTDHSKAIKLTGAGILCASSKVGDVWQWATAIDGSGIVANMITSGVLQASLVRILGTDRFYWDSSNITIIDTTDSNKQIRIGLYDGTNYGIGFTADGGATWQNAIGFKGLTIQAGSVTQDMLDPDIDLGGSTVYYSNSQPVSAKSGDIWYDTSNNHALMRYSGTVWENITDEALYSALSAANDAQATADGKIKTYAQGEAPSGMVAGDVGDLWIDINDNNKLYRYSGSKWEPFRDTHLDNTVSRHETRIEQNKDDISLRASITQMDAYVGGENLFLNASSSYINAQSDNDTPLALPNIGSVTISLHGLLVGSKVTFSLYIKPTSKRWRYGLMVTRNGISIPVLGGICGVGILYRPTLTYTITAGDTFIKPTLVNYDNEVGGVCQYSSLKLERGSKATPFHKAITNLESAIVVNANNINLKVSKGSVISEINQSAETIKIAAGKINLNGVVTANEYFKINLDGSMECTNGIFSGTLNAASGTFSGTLNAASGSFIGTVYAGQIQADNLKGFITSSQMEASYSTLKADVATMLKYYNGTLSAANFYATDVHANTVRSYNWVHQTAGMADQTLTYRNQILKTVDGKVIYLPYLGGLAYEGTPQWTEEINLKSIEFMAYDATGLVWKRFKMRFLGSYSSVSE